MAKTELHRGIRLVPSGIEIGGEVVPLLAGSVHYWRLDPDDWRACLESTKALGLRLVDVYVPWNVHEVAPGVLELGERDRQRDVAAFLRIAHELGLYAIVRPGPHINAELTYFGIPERVVWDPSCQARSPNGHPVMLPMMPFAFPVPSYASAAFHDEVARYFRALAPAITPLLYPHGPIVMLQIDNEGAFYFRDGVYDQDYHPDAIQLYRDFLREKYKTLEALQATYGAEGEEPPTDLRFATIDPPKKLDAKKAADLARHLDWSEFQEHLLTHALGRFADSLAAAGIDGLPTSHNLPPGQDATPLNAARLSSQLDVVGLDYYLDASPVARTIIARRTTELSTRCESLGVPALACEMGAGFPPFFPPLDEQASAFTVLAAMAYGLRAFNIYMAVERDRWIGAPIDPHGRVRPFAAFYRKLTSAIEATRFTELHRATPVRILTPRSERRLTRVMHAFGPFSGAFFSVIGKGARESAMEDDLGLGYAPAMEADTFARAFEAALESRGVPFAHIGGEDRRVSLEGSRWIVVASSGGLNPRLFGRLEAAAQAGSLVTIGPRAPVFDGTFKKLDAPLDLDRLRPKPSSVALLASDDPGEAQAAVSHAVDELGLATHACEPEGVFATVHEDAAGVLRVVFLINPNDADFVARVTIGAAFTHAHDVIDDTTAEIRRGVLEMRMKPRTVRMIAIS